MPVKNLLARLPAALIILFVGAALIATVIIFKPTPKPRAAKEPSLPRVEVMLAKPQTLAVNVNTQGTLAARRQIDLVSQVAGVITQVAPDFISGGFFTQGQMLVQIDPRDYRVAVARADAALKLAQQQLAIERGMVRQAKRQWRDLGDADANQLSLRQPQLAAAQAQLAAAQAEREQAQLNLARTQISLPFNGRIKSTRVDLGQFVAMGTNIATVYDASAALVRLPLTEQQAALINLPLGGAHTEPLPEVILRGTLAGEQREWRGQITHTEASVDPQTRLYYAIVEIPLPFAERAVPMLMGLYVEAEIQGKPLTDVVKLPKGALVRRDKIYSLDAQQRVQEKTVNILRLDEDWVWVQGDIAPGEAVVLSRQGYINPGAKVALVEAGPAAAVATPGAAQ